MAAPSYTYTLANSTTADADEVMQNFNDILNGVSDGSKDLSINALTVAGAAAFNGAVTLGNATGDDLTFTGRVASDFDPKTASTYDLGDATQIWQAAYVDNFLASINAVGDPSFSFHADTDTGIYSSGANALDFATGGVKALGLTSGQDVEPQKHVLAPVNDATNYDEGDPPYSFSGDTDTGMYSEGADQLNFSTGGTVAVSIDSSQAITCSGSLQASSFKGVPDTTRQYVTSVEPGSTTTMNNGESFTFTTVNSAKLFLLDTGAGKHGIFATGYDTATISALNGAVPSGFTITKSANNHVITVSNVSAGTQAVRITCLGGSITAVGAVV